jgi:hypothetical protein
MYAVAERALRDFHDGMASGRPMVQLLFELQGEFGDTGCNVRVAQSCTKHTQFLPYRAGAVLMLFEVCSGCLAYAQEAAKTGHELSVMEARAGIDGGL